MGHQMVDVRHPARHRILDGNHGELGHTVLHLGEGILEGGAGHGLIVREGIPAGDMGIGARLPLKGNAAAHGWVLAGMMREWVVKRAGREVATRSEPVLKYATPVAERPAGSAQSAAMPAATARRATCAFIGAPHTADSALTGRQSTALRAGTGTRMGAGDMTRDILTPARMARTGSMALGRALYGLRPPDQSA